MSEHDCCSVVDKAGYATPLDAFHHGPREKIVWVPCISLNPENTQVPDYLATIDVDPESPTFSKVIHRLHVSAVGDELHHTGYNTCSSCYGTGAVRSHLVAPGIKSGNIYYIDIVTNPREPRLDKVVKGEDIKKQTHLAFPHTPHCLATGEIMISHMGDEHGNAPGGFLLIDQQGNIKGRWEKGEKRPQFNYDFWYQPRQNILVSSEWGAPVAFAKHFDPSQVPTHYGRRLHFWNWTTHELEQTIDLGNEGLVPLELRFHHNPDSTHGYVACALASAVFHFWKGDDGTWKSEKVIQVEPYDVEGWALPQMPGLITDILISLDDKYLYLSNWLHGDVRAYDISDPFKPRLVGQTFLGGSLRGGVKILNGRQAPKLELVQGGALNGGPQMLQLSLDGKRIYVTDSLFGPWDTQFYPGLIQGGSKMYQLDVDRETGAIKPNESFLIDFGKEPFGPVLAHEVRYPGGDCSSDVWA